MCICCAVINVWTIDANKTKSKNRRNSQQINGDKDLNTNTNENIIQATNQKFGNNGKIAVKNSGLGHEGKYTPKYLFNILKRIAYFHKLSKMFSSLYLNLI